MISILEIGEMEFLMDMENLTMVLQVIFQTIIFVIEVLFLKKRLVKDIQVNMKKVSEQVMVPTTIQMEDHLLEHFKMIIEKVLGSCTTPKDSEEKADGFKINS